MPFLRNILLLAALAPASVSSAEEPVAPILQKCVTCHNSSKLAGKLDLTTRKSALERKETALIPGSPEKSLIFDKVSIREMPPDDPLSDKEIAIVRTWIKEGAKWPNSLQTQKEAQRAGADWWSLQPLRKTAGASPAARPEGQNPIDAFVLAQLHATGLTQAPSADRTTLIRRATFDLHGLPPTPEEIDAFLKDQSPNAYEKLIDRLLGSPRYGERWGRHWLDAARFSESQGFERDKIRDHAWRYRDYVIRSFNDDKPYDQFVREQVAGDVLPGAGPDGVIATGFLVAGPWDEAGSGSASALLRARIREEELEDMLSAVSQTFLGLTVNCARCHGHKFDPILQKDYYRLKSVFDGVRHGDRAVPPDAKTLEQKQRQARLDAALANAEKKLAALETAGRNQLPPAKAAALPVGVPFPIGRWTFDGDARDSIGTMHGTLRGPARIANGRLILNGRGAFVETAPLESDLKEKTLEAWVALPDRGQRGGGVISVQTKNGGTFDAIVFGERQPAKWMAGSNGFVRTRELVAADETAAPGDLVHMAITYAASGQIAIYRNGQPYAPPYKPDGEILQTYRAGQSQMLFGLRHFGAGNGFLTGEIEEARLYDKALTAKQVTASFQAGVASITRADILAAMTPSQRADHDQLSREIARLRSESGPFAPPSQIAYAANSKQPEPTAILLRGDVELKGDIVSAGGLSAVKTPPADLGLSPNAPEGERRIRFANWLTDPKNPLTARVMVNRIWHHHFGRGIVDTPNDFGFNGGRPSHPELLDWLASELINPTSFSGKPKAQAFSLKNLHRVIMTSATYRQSAAHPGLSSNPKSEIRNPKSIDADNRLLWHFAPQRLEAEEVRDAMLAVGGRLNPTMGGPGFRPFTVTVFNSSFYNLFDKDEPEYNRRTVYRTAVQSAKDPFLESFDCPEPSVKTPRRSITTTPIQALGLMNNAFVQRQANYLAARAKREAGENATAQVDRAYRLALGREPSSSERERAAGLAREHGLASVCWVLLNSSEFLYVR